MDAYKNGRLAVIKEMITWLESEISNIEYDRVKNGQHVKNEQIDPARIAKGGCISAHLKTLEKLKVKRAKTENNKKTSK